MSKRRAHRKSRDGCAECKRRHIKCDEGKPKCLHCSRHNIPCIYRGTLRANSENLPIEDLSPQSDLSCSLIGQDAYAQVSPAISSTPDGNPKDLFRMSDMALLHHWTTVAGHSILNTIEIDHYWHTVLPMIGFKFQYVIHSILSISALHIAYTNPTDRRAFLLVAGEHRSKALDGFAEDLHTVGPENSDALFANAMLTFFYAFISFSNIFDTEYSDTRAQNTRTLGAEWIALVRGTATVLAPVYEFVQEGPLKAFLEIHDFIEVDPTEEIHASAYITHLVQIQEIWAADEHACVYNEASYLLRKCSAWMTQFQKMGSRVGACQGYHGLCSGPFIWLFDASEKYLLLHEQRQPPALIIFAYYGVLIHQLDGYWWAEGCGRSIVSAVDECLGPYWSSWTEWPKQAVGLYSS